MVNFHLGTLQEAIKEQICDIQKTLFLKNAVTHTFRWEHSLALESAGLRILIQSHDVTQASKEHQNAKYQQKKATQG